MWKKISILAAFTLIIFLGCETDETIGFGHKESSIKKDNSDFKQEYEMSLDNMKLKVFLEKTNNKYQNTFEYSNTDSGEVIFELEYSFDTTEQNWKYKEQRKALDFSKKLKTYNLSLDKLNKLNTLLDEGYFSLFSQVYEKNYDLTLFSCVAYLKSALSANIRSTNNNTDIRGIMHPGFLVGKSFFLFQEDDIVDLNNLRSHITLLEAEANRTGFSSDLNVVDFIKTSPKDKIAFDELYSFYITRTNFEQFIAQNEVYNEGDCSGSCSIGCGTDWGCCGSYMGCCYYSSYACLQHDLACINCDKWHCGPGCTPDGGHNRVVKALIGIPF